MRKASKACPTTDPKPAIPPPPVRPLDLEALRAFRAKLPEQKQTAGDLIRWMRDTDRY
jgi:hypothetical protein